MWIVLAALALVFLGGGVAGALVLHAGGLPEPNPRVLQLVEQLAFSVGLGLAFLAAALAHRKLARMDKVMTGRSLSSRLRRTRVLKRAQEEEADSSGESDAYE